MLNKILKLMIIEGISYEDFEDEEYFNDKISIWLEVEALPKELSWVNYIVYKTYIDSI